MAGAGYYGAGADGGGMQEESTVWGLLQQAEQQETAAEGDQAAVDPARPIASRPNTGAGGGMQVLAPEPHPLRQERAPSDGSKQPFRAASHEELDPREDESDDDGGVSGPIPTAPAGGPTLAELQAEKAPKASKSGLPQAQDVERLPAGMFSQYASEQGGPTAQELHAGAPHPAVHDPSRRPGSGASVPMPAVEAEKDGPAGAHFLSGGRIGADTRPKLPGEEVSMLERGLSKRKQGGAELSGKTGTLERMAQTSKSAANLHAEEHRQGRIMHHSKTVAALPRRRGEEDGKEEGEASVDERAMRLLRDMGPKAAQAIKDQGLLPRPGEEKAPAERSGGKAEFSVPKLPPGSMSQDQIDMMRREEETFRLQGEIRSYMTRRSQLSARAKQLKRTELRLRREIAELEIRRMRDGGKDAVKANERTVKKNMEILDKRIMRARATKMAAIDRNDETRRAINQLRRDKVAQVEACDRYEADIRRLQRVTAGQLEEISQLDDETRGIEGQLEGEIEQGRAELREMEQEWERLGMAGAGRPLPTSLPAAADKDSDEEEESKGQDANGKKPAIKVRLRGADKSLLKAEHSARRRERKLMARMRKDQLQGNTGAQASTVPADEEQSEEEEEDARDAERVRQSVKRGDGESKQEAAARRTRLARRRRRRAARTKKVSGPPSERLTNPGKGKKASGGGDSTGRKSTGSRPASRAAAAAQEATAAERRAKVKAKREGASGTIMRRERWRTALLSAKQQNLETKVGSMRELFEKVKGFMGVDNVEDFADKFLEANEANYALFARVDSLAKENDETRAQIMAKRDKARLLRQQQAEEQVERAAVMGTVEGSMSTASQRATALRREKLRLERMQRALRDGLKSVLETADLASAVREGLQSNALPSRLLTAWFELLTVRVKQILSVYARLASKDAQDGMQSPSLSRTGGSSMVSNPEPGLVGDGPTVKPVARMPAQARRRSLEHTTADMRRLAALQAHETTQSTRKVGLANLGVSGREVVSRRTLTIGPVVPES